MEKVLIIANQFPPMGGSGVQRTSKFVKHLRSFGFEPVVFTREEKGMLLKDETLLLDIPEGVKVIRTKAYAPSEFKGILRVGGKVISKYFLVPDGDRLWEITSRKKALEVVDKENIKIIYSTSAPYSDHLLGMYIKKNRPHVKWVVDFRDEWTNNPYTLDNPHNAFRTSKEKKMEAEVLKLADRHITNTPVMASNFMKNNSFMADMGKSFVVIPNGYDEEDFEALEHKEEPNKVFTLSYTGALYGRRKPDYFFKSVSELINEGKIDPDLIKINFIGNYKATSLENTVKSLGIDNVVNIHGYMPHRECLQILVDSDALLLLEGSGVGSDAFYTGKIFEYMKTDRPVLALIPEGCARDLIRETGIGIIADFDDVTEIKEALLSYYDSWKKGELKFSPNEDEIKKYERKVLTEKLSQVFLS